VENSVLDSSTNSVDAEFIPPRVEETQGGATVFYKSRYLYSKRQPRKQIETVVASFLSSERTLFIFASPVLGYGVPQLINTLHPSSFLLLIEYDEFLGTLFEDSFWKKFNTYLINASNVSHSNSTSNNFIPNGPTSCMLNFTPARNATYLCTKDKQAVVEKIRSLTGFNFKRIEMIRGSAGFSLYEDFYANLLHLLEEEMSCFWKNRITLIEMARLYSRNIFKWMRQISEDTKRFKILPKNSVEKPILVIGAGPSLDSSLSFIKENREQFFLLAVDVALPTLSSMEVEADAVVLLEGQYWIESAFLQSKYRKIPLFASITSNPHVFNILQSEVFFYSIEFAPIAFLKNFTNTFPNIYSFSPLASVGLLALQLALFIAKNGVPIFHTGLDFSYSQGFSHARSSMHPQNITIGCSRLKGLYCSSLFPLGCQKVKGKNDKFFWSTPILGSYACIYKREFLHYKNIFDIGKTGLILRDYVLKEAEVEGFLKSLKQNKAKATTLNYTRQEETLNIEKVESFLSKEKEKLTIIKNMLTGIDEWNSKIFANIIKSCDYLYLHFPDYPTLKDENMFQPSFLKRIRIEVEYFLKVLR